MRHTLTTMTFLVVTSVMNSCKKDDLSNPNCFAGDATIRQITNAPATVKKGAAKFYLVEAGVIDTKLNPCTLDEEFQVDNLQVIISGEVKLTQPAAFEPCCTDNLVISKISR